MVSEIPTTALNRIESNGREPARIAAGFSFVGHGVCIGHLTEIVQGPYPEASPTGRPPTVLMSLPNHSDRVVAFFTASAAVDNVSVLPGDRRKACAAVEATRAYLRSHGYAAPGGFLVVNSSIPVGKGRGSSTADAIAAVLAYADAVQVSLNDAQVTKLVFEVERASDPLQLFRWGYPVLFASREGRLIKTFAQPLPPMRCLGFDTDPERIVPTDAVVARTHYSTHHIAAMPAIFALLERGIATTDVQLIGQAATQSAALNQEILSTRNFERLLSIAQHVGAAGMTVSHSGTYAALLWDGALDVTKAQQDAEGLVLSLGCTDVNRFVVQPDP